MSTDRPSTAANTAANTAGTTVFPESPATPPRRRPDVDPAARAGTDVVPDTGIGSGAGPTQAALRSREPRSRGKLTLSEQVIAKIAAQSASEVSSAGGRSGGLLGLGAHSDLHAKPKVDVELRETSADLFVAVSLPWGTSIRQTTQQVREQVTQRVHELTGVSVHRVDIDVAVLVLSDPSQDEGVLR